MRLKRLELFGFKSFADRVVLDFADHTLTGIVGPNGCGKSNVVDSVRWVLGEMRPTSMRGEGMTDVIFKGSASRPPLGMAEVTIVLDNEGAAIEERGAEVAIQRRLYRSGESEYRIDGEKVRLKDVRDMLYDTGLGSRGYSVLEQGRIDAVLSANPLQRRAIFEEAAGISRYRQRRHETELRLKRVEQDVVRLEDVMGELRTRVRSLKIQAGKAERWVELKGEWSRERTRLLRHRFDRLGREHGDLGPRAAELEAALEELRGERARCEEEMRAREEERARLVGELDRLSGAAARIAGEVRAIEERRTQLALRVETWEQSAQEESERGRDLSTQLVATSAEAGVLAGEIVDLRAALEAAESSAARLAGELRELNRRYREVRAAVQQQNETVLGCLHRRTAAQNRERHLLDSRAPATEREERARSRLADLDQSLESVRAEVGDAEIERERSRALLAEIEDRRGRSSSELAEVEHVLDVARDDRSELELEQARLLSRAEALMDREAEQADLSAGTRAVLEAIEAGAGPCGAEQLQGLVADALGTDLHLARALDVVLAERATALVARDRASVRAIVDWLVARREGQVGVVLPTALTQREMRPVPEDAPGMLGRLIESVRCAEGCEPLAAALLGDVLVVESFERALELVELHPAWRFVTPSGELVDAAGVVGGHREVTQGPIGRRSTAADLAQEADRKALGIAALDDSMLEIVARRDSLRGELVEIAAARDASARELSAAEARLATARARVTDLELSRRLSAVECEQARGEVEALLHELAAVQGERTAAEEAFREENEELAEMEVCRRGLEEERERLAREEGRAQVETTRLRSELSAHERRAQDLARRIGEQTTEIERATRRAQEHSESAERGRAESLALAGAGEEMAIERTSVEAALEALRESERAGREHLEGVRVRMESVQRRCDQRASELADARMELQRLGLALEELVRRAQEELAMDREALSAAFDAEPELALEGALDALEAHTSELRSQLEKTGPVNMEAVDELAEVSVRLEHLETQAADLVQARASLAGTIEKIDEESRRLFLETFNEVGEHFQRIFRQLFGGGKAEITLEQGVDVLEAGIEISARPPGREMLPISLLSGGQRTMTALALLFAVFQARPSPFCVLDEVDAALDDANIDRFLAMLEGFRTGTQFIVVTHNKGTMGACQALYGVTMEIKGVSRFVAVELSEVDGIAPGAREPAGEQENGEGPARKTRVDAESGERLVELVPPRGTASREPSFGAQELFLRPLGTSQQDPRPALS